jgi:hypothetical protein
VGDAGQSWVLWGADTHLQTLRLQYIPTDTPPPTHTNQHAQTATFKANLIEPRVDELHNALGGGKALQCQAGGRGGASTQVGVGGRAWLALW